MIPIQRDGGASEDRGKGREREIRKRNKKKPEGPVVQCEAKSARTVPENAPRTHTQPAFVFLFHPEKSTMGFLLPRATWKWKREALKRYI